MILRRSVYILRNTCCYKRNINNINHNKHDYFFLFFNITIYPIILYVSPLTYGFDSYSI